MSATGDYEADIGWLRSDRPGIKLYALARQSSGRYFEVRHSARLMHLLHRDPGVLPQMPDNRCFRPAKRREGGSNSPRYDQNPGHPALVAGDVVHVWHAQVSCDTVEPLKGLFFLRYCFCPLAKDIDRPI